MSWSKCLYDRKASVFRFGANIIWILGRKCLFKVLRAVCMDKIDYCLYFRTSKKFGSWGDDVFVTLLNLKLKIFLWFCWKTVFWFFWCFVSRPGWSHVSEYTNNPWTPTAAAAPTYLHTCFSSVLCPPWRCSTTKSGFCSSPFSYYIFEYTAEMFSVAVSSMFYYLCPILTIQSNRFCFKKDKGLSCFNETYTTCLPHI